MSGATTPRALARAVSTRLRAVLPGKADLATVRRDPRRDLIAGVTVAIVALPLALGFGISSGLGAEAGMVTAVVAGAVDTDTDAHVFVLHRGIDGEVWVHTLDKGIRTDMRVEEWTPTEGRLYGIVLASEDHVDGTPTYTPEHPIVVGDYPVGVAGYDFPRHRLGGESGVSASDRADRAARLRATLGEAGLNDE